MNQYRVLYYPHFRPNPRWLLSILLLIDEVDRIVPKDADPEDPNLIRELIQEIPGAFVSYSPDIQDIQLEPLTLARLKQAFRHIREQSFGDKKHSVQLRLRGGTVEIDGHVFLHHAKVESSVRDLLVEEGLLVPSLEDMTREFGIENYYPVPEQASNLILSCVADRIARREGLDTVTDEELDFVTMSMNSHRVAIGHPQGSVEGALASAVARVMIPDGVETLGIRIYKDLRESYAPLREAFKDYVIMISALDRLGRIEDPNVLSERITAAAERIERECDAYTKSTYARRFKQWAPFAMCSMLSIVAGIVNPAYGVIFAVGSTSVELLRKVFIEHKEGAETPGVCRLLASMRKDILGRVAIDALA